jgi:hypothetical protein
MMFGNKSRRIKALEGARDYWETMATEWYAQVLKSANEIRTLNRCCANKAKLKKMLKEQTKINKELMEARLEDLKVIQELSSGLAELQNK